MSLASIGKRTKELFTGSHLQELTKAHHPQLQSIRQAEDMISRSRDKHTPVAHAALKHIQGKRSEMTGEMAGELNKVLATQVGASAAGVGALHGLKKHLDNKQKSKEAGFSSEEKLACARALLAEGVVTSSQALDLAKYATVSPEQARRSLDRLDTLEQSKPTVRQLGRYGGIGAVGGAAIGAMGNAIEHGGALRGATPKAKLLNVAANSVKGALGGGAIPLVRSGLDRRAEQGTLRKFMRENPGEPHA